MALSILLVRGLAEGVEQAGVRRETFLARASFDAARLDDGDLRISVEEYDRLVELAIELTDNHALGLHMGQAASATTYSLVAHLVAHATTMRHAIQSLLRYHRLLTDRSAYQLIQHDGSATLRFEVAPGTATCRRFHAELTLAGLFRMVQFFGRGDGLRNVTFEHERPHYGDEYARLFNGLERFEQASSAVTFDTALLDQVQLHADAEFHAALEAQAQLRVLRLGGDAEYADRVLRYLLECDATERQDMAVAARHLGVSVRTLRRRLQDERASYGDLTKRALAMRATQLVAEGGRTIDEAAYMLGFSERSAFHRAFKRWTGTTPKEYRRRSRKTQRG